MAGESHALQLILGPRVLLKERMAEIVVPGTDSSSERLLGRLATRFPWVQARGEVLATHALACVLESNAARHALASVAASTVRQAVPWEDLAFEPEAYQHDATRVDLEGSTVGPDGDVPHVMIEAKFDAILTMSQVATYFEHQTRRLAEANVAFGVLLILVPESRLVEAQAVAEAAIGPRQEQFTPERARGIEVLVKSWSVVLDALDEGMGTASESSSEPGPLVEDLRQLRSLCTVLGGAAVVPFSPQETGAAWRTRIDDYAKIVDRVTLALAARRTPGARIFPLRHASHGLATYRYVGADDDYLAVAVIDPARDIGWPVGVFYHRDTPGYSKVREALGTAEMIIEENSRGLVTPLSIKSGIGGAAVVEALVEEVERLDNVARSR